MNNERSARRAGCPPHELARWHDAARRNAARSELANDAACSRVEATKRREGEERDRTRAPERRPGVESEWPAEGRTPEGPRANRGKAQRDAGKEKVRGLVLKRWLIKVVEALSS